MPSYRLRALIIWGLASTFYFYEFLLQVSPSVMVPELMDAFRVNAASLGNLAAFYFYAYASMQIPVGVLLDHYGARKLLTIAAAICAIGSLIFAQAENIVIAGVGRTLIGLGSSFAIVGCMSLAARWFPPKRFALLAGITVTIGMLGATVGEAPLALAVQRLDWRYTMTVLAIIGAVISLFIWLLVRDHPPGEKSRHEPTPQDRLSTGLNYVLRNRQSWLAAIYAGLMYIPTTSFAALWGVSFLTIAYHFSKPLAAAYISTIFIGWAVGAPLCGWISDYIGRRKPPMFIGSVGALSCFSIAIYVNHLPPIILGMLLFGFGFFSSGFLLAFSIVREINPHRFSGTSLGFTNMLNMVGGAAAQPLIGVILDYFWNGKIVDGARAFSLYAYHWALLLIPIVILISIIILPFVKETFCMSAENIPDLVTVE